MDNDDKILIFLSIYGEVLVKEKDTLWIWSKFLDGPIIATDAYLFESCLILIDEIERKEWKNFRKYMKKHLKE
jgi:hypothetical protein